MRFLVGLGLLGVVGCMSAPDQPAQRTGSMAVAITASDVDKFYLGQPGIEADIAKIDQNQSLSYHWWRIEVPTQDVGATVDMSKATGGATLYLSYPGAPGCAGRVPWVAKWSAGDPGVTGAISVEPTADGYSVDFNVTFSGYYSPPCGQLYGELSTDNHFVAVPIDGSK